jgi:hypothetical protein
MLGNNALSYSRKLEGLNGVTEAVGLIESRPDLNQMAFALNDATNFSLSLYSSGTVYLK